MKAIAIINLKGGTGKTMTAINMAHILATDYHKRVLLIDADSQHNATDFFGAADADSNLYAYLMGKSEPCYADVVAPSGVPGLDILPGDDSLMYLDISTFREQRCNVNAMVDLLTFIAEDDSYDYVIVDCPPAFNAASSAALAAVSEAIIPTKLDAFSVSGLSNVIKQIQSMHHINPALRVRGILITMRTPAQADAEQQLRKLSGSFLPVFKQAIRYSDKVDGSTYEGEALTAYSPRSAAGVDYRRFVAEYLGEV